MNGALRALTGVAIEAVLAGLIAQVAMLTQSAAMMSILAGRDDGGISLSQTARQHRALTAMRLVPGLASYRVSPLLLLWMSPVVLGLALAIPVGEWTAGRGPGQA